MTMLKYVDLIAEVLPHIKEIFPWDLEEKLQADPPTLLVDIREPYEFDALHAAGSINVPRGILESACEYDYEETLPQLVQARQQPVVLICRSGYRSALAAHTLQRMGYQDVYSLKTGLRGWNDAELPLVNAHGETVDLDEADAYFAVALRPEQMRPKEA